MDVIALCMEEGASRAEELALDALVFRPELRAFCEQNTCGNYGRNYACPPLIGDVRLLGETLRPYARAFFWQSIVLLEDSFDIEGMTAGRLVHNERARSIARRLREVYGNGNVLVLSAGGCELCGRLRAVRALCRCDGRALPFPRRTAFLAGGIWLAGLGAGQGVGTCLQQRREYS